MQATFSLKKKVEKKTTKIVFISVKLHYLQVISGFLNSTAGIYARWFPSFNAPDHSISTITHDTGFGFNGKNRNFYSLINITVT